MLIGFIIKWSPTQHVSYICKIVDEKLFRTNQNNTHHTRFMKKHQQDILTPYPGTVVFEISIYAGACYSYQASCFNRCANDVWFKLCLSLYMSNLCYHNKETMSIAESSEILQNVRHPNRVQ